MSSGELRKCLGVCGQYKEHGEFFSRGDWKRDDTKSLRNSSDSLESLIVATCGGDSLNSLLF